MGVRWKVCGITRIEDARRAVELGADALGFVFYPPSPRCLDASRARGIAAELPDGVLRVGVFVDEPAVRLDELAAEVGLDLLQLCGDEPPERCRSLSRPVVKALRLNQGLDREEAEARAEPYRDCTLLLDGGDAGGELYGGTGQRADWRVAGWLARRRDVILAGGLRPDNVGAAIETVGPWGVDVSSGVESEPGRKDPALLEAFATALEPYR